MNFVNNLVLLISFVFSAIFYLRTLDIYNLLSTTHNIQKVKGEKYKTTVLKSKNTEAIAQYKKLSKYKILGNISFPIGILYNILIKLLLS